MYVRTRIQLRAYTSARVQNFLAVKPRSIGRPLAACYGHIPSHIKLSILTQTYSFTLYNCRAFIIYFQRTNANIKLEHIQAHRMKPRTVCTFS